MLLGDLERDVERPLQDLRPVPGLPHRDTEPTPGRRGGEQVRKGSPRVVEEHHPEARQNQIEVGGRKFSPLGVGHHPADVGAVVRSPARLLDEVGGDVESDHLAIRAYRVGRPSGGGPPPASHVEHPFPGRHLSGGEQQVAHRFDLRLEPIGHRSPRLRPLTRPVRRRHPG